MLSRFIFVTTKKEGFHKYPDAPEGVEFLKFRHRHLFGVKVQLEVFHNERELEFILVKRDLEKYLDKRLSEDENNSCESIAESVYNYMKTRYDNDKRLVEVTIDEDGENGGIISDLYRGAY